MGSEDLKTPEIDKLANSGVIFTDAHVSATVCVPSRAGLMTDVLGDQSVKFAEQSKDTPFFMYLAYNAVHTPMDAKEEDLEKFKGHPRQKLAAMTWSLDENVGKLL